MAAPSYVPKKADRLADASYTSPRRRIGPWRADRPGEIFGNEESEAAGLGYPGPDQGYVLRLARHFEPRLHLDTGEGLADVIAGGVAVALKRASLFGRAPVAEDLEVAFDLFGFLTPDASDELIARRRDLFIGAAGHDGYNYLRRIADRVPTSVLCRATGESPA